MMTTLVSQYAEAGALFASLTGLPQPLVRLLAASGLVMYGGNVLVDIDLSLFISLLIV